MADRNKVERLPSPADRSAFDRFRETLTAKAGETENSASSSLLSCVSGDADAADFIATVLDASPHLASLIDKYPGDALNVLTGTADNVFDDILRETASARLADCDEANLMCQLRRQKARAALVIALADLARLWSLERVTGALSAFADAAIKTAVDWLLHAAHRGGKIVLPDPHQPGRSSGYVVIAMGKYGAGELNYSSDVDLIVFYDPHTAPVPAGSDVAKLFVRLTQGLVKLLQERTRDGYVFRTDLRLRPDPRATSVAISIDAAAQYYESMGQNWERAAMIKARPVAGDISAGREFLSNLAPFIWRKYLDFAAIADIQSLKRQIHAFKGHGEIAVEGHNIKLGRGGIREIEFFVQTQQLIAGGRIPELRGNRTVDMLHRLSDFDWISSSAAEELQEAYEFLRALEHRLQMMEDEQTHTLPVESDKLDRFSRLAGFDSRDALASELMKYLTSVQGHYAALFEAAPSLGDGEGSLVFTGADDDPDTIATLTRMGYERASDVSAAIRSWHFGRVPAMRSARARERLTELTPVLLDALARTGQPDQAFLAFDKFLSGLPAGVQLFSLLHANPALLDLVASILGAAPKLAKFLSQRPQVLDAVLDPGFFATLPDREELVDYLQGALPIDEPFEELLDRARVIGREQRFRIGVRLLSDTLAGYDAGRAYSTVAETLVARLFEIVRHEFEGKHGRLEGSEMAIVGMGKLGSSEMTASSDLDLMLIYDTPPGAQSSVGGKPLMASQYFGRYTQRLINALTAPTAEGRLYEVDMRLRPSGNKGPIATHIESFIDYHRESAWTWEKLALTRARVVAGDTDLSARVKQSISNVLCSERDRAAVARDAREMRQRIVDEKPAVNHWDLKQARGGLVDLEFICQFLQISSAFQTPEVLEPNTEQAFSALIQHGVLPETAGMELCEAHRMVTVLNQILSLCVQNEFSLEDAPPALGALLLRTADMPDMKQLDAALRGQQALVKEAFDRIVS